MGKGRGDEDGSKRGRAEESRPCKINIKGNPLCTILAILRSLFPSFDSSNDSESLDAEEMKHWDWLFSAKLI